MVFYSACATVEAPSDNVADAKESQQKFSKRHSGALICLVSSAGFFDEGYPEGYHTLSNAAAAEILDDEGACLRMALEHVEAFCQSHQGTPQACPAGENCNTCCKARGLLSSLLAADVPAQLLQRFSSFGFETQKDVMWFFDALLHFSTQLSMELQVVEYFRDHPLIFHLLIEGCGKPETVMHFGHILRACGCRVELAALLLDWRATFRLIEFMQHQSFDVTSDAVVSLQTLLLHTQAATKHLETHFDDFFDIYHSLLLAEDYFTRRQALWLLGHMLLKGDFTAVMMKYISNIKFLQIHMNLLKSSSQRIQVGAFHVFKLFVANPYKPHHVQIILSKNQSGLLRRLVGLQEGTNDVAFGEDLRAVIEMVEALPQVTKRRDTV